MGNKNHKPTSLRRVINGIASLPTYITMTVVAAAIVAIAIIIYMSKGNSINFENNNKIDVTPTTIQSIEQIGEWEFLSISNEELIDTVRHGFFGDDELVRIYYGTLRLGVDLQEAKPEWIAVKGDSVIVTLPPIKLLDHDFIDEAQTRSFFEKGKWSHDDMAAMYQRAHRAMTARCMSKENIETARLNATAQFTKLMHSLGFDNVSIRFEDQARKD